jgi:hypothetical protein
LLVAKSSLDPDGFGGEFAEPGEPVEALSAPHAATSTHESAHKVDRANRGILELLA